MKIYVSTNQNYPALMNGAGSERIMDNIVKGLSELGHEVFHHIKKKINGPAFKGVTFVSQMPKEIDIAVIQDLPSLREPFYPKIPWLKTHHGPGGAHFIHPKLMDHIIFVSRAQAQFHQSERYVYNGIDPSEFMYSETKEDYLLFMVSHLERAVDKGIEIALQLAKRTGIRLLVAGGVRKAETLTRFLPIFNTHNADYIGPISGTQKGELLAGAKAVLFPTQLNEAFGLVITEALISGTPVICSDFGACPEIVTSDVGFVCESKQDYEKAIDNLNTIQSARCRSKVMTQFHYLEMAKNYVREYEKQIANYA
ncbi:MAG: hypothetical protein Aureis2KO_25660 [Aureisphaera sp.]